VGAQALDGPASIIHVVAVHFANRVTYGFDRHSGDRCRSVEMQRSPPRLAWIIQHFLLLVATTTQSPKMGAIEDNKALSNALFTGVRPRVLALIFGNPERSFYTSEILGK
jgi:hypothetical protein